MISIHNVSDAYFDEGLNGLNERFAGMSWWHPRRLGWFMLQVGVALGVCSLLFSMRGMQYGTALAIIGAILAGVPIWRLSVFWFGMAFCIWMAVSWSHGRWIAHYPQLPRPQLMGGLGIFGYWLLIPLGITVFSQHGARKWTERLLLFSVILAGTLLLSQVAMGNALPMILGIRGEGRSWTIPQWLTQDLYRANPLTTAFIMSMAFLWVYAGLSSAIALWIRIVAIVFVVGSVACIAERSAAIGMMAGLLVLIACSNRKREGILKGILLVVILLVLGLAVAHFRPSMLTYMMHGQDGRLPLWQCGWEVVCTHPVFGAGGEPALEAIMHDTALSLNIPVPGFTPHQFFLSLSGCYGIPALVFFLLFIVSALQSISLHTTEYIPAPSDG